MYVHILRVKYLGSHLNQHDLYLISKDFCKQHPVKVEDDSNPREEQMCHFDSEKTDLNELAKALAESVGLEVVVRLYVKE